MRLGISVTSFHQVEDPREGPRRMISRVKAAWDAGLDSLFVGDHHATPLPYYQNSPILARLLAEWGDRTAGALYLLPLWHPVLLAEQVATLAALADGPFVLQCALGDDARQFAAMGVELRHRPSRFEQCLDCLRRLWRGEQVDSDGRYFFVGARVSPQPPRPIDVWIGASAPVAIERAARLGDGWIASPHLTPLQTNEQLRAYEQACLRVGKNPGARVLRRDVYVGEDDRDVRQWAAPVLDRGYRGFPTAALVVGTPPQAAEQLAGFAKQGYDEVLVRNLVADPAAALASTQRLGAVRAALAAVS